MRFQTFLLVLSMVSILATNAYSQENKFNASIQYGIGYYKVYGHSTGAKFDYAFSPSSFSLGADYQLFDKLSLGVEIEYVEKRTSVGEKSSYFDFYRLKFITVSTLGKYHLGKEKRLSVIAGPFLGRLLEYNLDGKVIESNHYQDEYGVDFGIDYKISLTDQLNLLLGGRSEVSFRKFSYTKTIAMQFRTGIVLGF